MLEPDIVFIEYILDGPIGLVKDLSSFRQEIDCYVLCEKKKSPLGFFFSQSHLFVIFHRRSWKMTFRKQSSRSSSALAEALKDEGGRGKVKKQEDKCFLFFQKNTICMWKIAFFTSSVSRKVLVPWEGLAAQKKRNKKSLVGCPA